MQTMYRTKKIYSQNFRPYSIVIVVVIIEICNYILPDKKTTYKLNDKEGDQNAPFSIATTPRCRGGRYSFPWIAPLCPWYVPCIAELSKEISSTIFKVFGMTQPGIEPRSLVNTLPMNWLHCVNYKENKKLLICVIKIWLL